MWETVLWPVGGALVRVIPGWLENAFEDGKIERFEVAKLAATLLRVGVATFSVSVGFDMEVPTSVAVATGADFIMTWLDGIFRKKN